MGTESISHPAIEEKHDGLPPTEGSDVARLNINPVLLYTNSLKSPREGPLEKEKMAAMGYLRSNLDRETLVFFNEWIENISACHDVGQCFSDCYANLHYELQNNMRGGFFVENDHLLMMLVLAKEATEAKFETIHDSQEHLVEVYSMSNQIASDINELMTMQYNDESTAVSAQTLYHMVMNLVNICRSEEEVRALIFPIVDAFVHASQRPIQKTVQQSYLGVSGIKEADRESGETVFNEMIRILHSRLEKIKLSADEIRFIVSSVLAAPSPVLINSATKLLTANKDQAVDLLLEAARENDELCRKTALSLLFRLELGRVKISEQGLDYLGRRFELEGEHQYAFAHRLTASGKVGVFDGDERLQGFVQLEADDFSDERTEGIGKKVQEIAIEMLFTPNPDETEQEKAEREGYLKEFTARYFDTYKGMFSGESDFKINNLELPEQGWVLQFLNKANPEQEERFFSFLSRHGEDGFRVFRIAEFAGDRALNTIITKDQEIESFPDIAKVLSDIYELAEDAVSMLVSKFPEHFSQYEQSKMVQNILKIAANIVDGVAKMAENPEADFVPILTMGGELKPIYSGGDLNVAPDVQKALPRFIRDRSYVEFYIELGFLIGTLREIFRDDIESSADAINALLFNESISIADLESIDLEEAVLDPKIYASLQRAGFDFSGGIPNSPTVRLQALKHIYSTFHSPEYLESKEISEKLKRLYDKPPEEFNLRNYEGKTTDNIASLNRVWKTIESHIRVTDSLLSEEDPAQSYKLNTILDICGGGGRSGIPFTYLGEDITVNAYDISPEMVERARKRVQEDASTHELYNQALEAGMPLSPIEERGRYSITEGDFHTFGLPEYRSAFPESSRPQIATILWHSFCFAGDLEGQYEVLKKAHEVLDEKGALIIEIPDRSFGAYRKEIAKFHTENPDTLYGTLVDAPSKEEGEASAQDEKILTPRYFPSLAELEELLQRAGFSVASVDSHFVYHTTLDGKKTPVIRELVITAIK